MTLLWLGQDSEMTVRIRKSEARHYCLLAKVICNILMTLFYLWQDSEMTVRINVKNPKRGIIYFQRSFAFSTSTINNRRFSFGVVGVVEVIVIPVVVVA